jgi:hypothetical protein
MLTRLLMQAHNHDWFTKQFILTSSVIETYIFGFENAFGYHDEVVVETRPDQIRLDLVTKSLLTSLILVEVKNPLNLD